MTKTKSKSIAITISIILIYSNLVSVWLWEMYHCEYLEFPGQITLLA